MNINELTIGEVKELKSMFGGSCSIDEHPYKTGQAYLVRTVTHYYIGIMKWIGDKEFVMSSASWIPDTGRYHNALKEGKLEEVEPIIGDVIIGRGAVIDCVLWNAKVPQEQK